MSGMRKPQRQDLLLNATELQADLVNISSANFEKGMQLKSTFIKIIIVSIVSSVLADVILLYTLIEQVTTNGQGSFKYFFLLSFPEP